MNSNFKEIYDKAYEEGFADGANQQEELNQELVLNTIGVIENLLKIVGELNDTNSSALTEEECVLEDAKQVLNQLYELKETR